jgi:hypothetical protein
MANVAPQRPVFEIMDVVLGLQATPALSEQPA